MSDGLNRWSLSREVMGRLDYELDELEQVGFYGLKDRIWDFFIEPTVESAKLLHDELCDISRELQ